MAFVRPANDSAVSKYSAHRHDFGNNYSNSLEDSNVCHCFSSILMVIVADLLEVLPQNSALLRQRLLCLRLHLLDVLQLTTYGGFSTLTSALKIAI